MTKNKETWLKEFPVLKNIIPGNEIFWINPFYSAFENAQNKLPLTNNDILNAEERLKRFAPFIASVFPETSAMDGIIESPLQKVPELQKSMERISGKKIDGRLLLKCDSHLAISGSIKARGGIYEVLKHAETLAISHRLISKEDDFALFDSAKFRDFFSNYAIAAGSTGNLGLSIGIIGAALGFNVHIHMSSDAKEWKKELLKKKGVNVIEYTSDYSKAVSEGRKQAEADERIHFIDDENSSDLFLGYSVAARRLVNQLRDLNIIVDETHPLFVYLPCGVGGAPGGITFGLKQMFKDNVHCFFAEPTASPCMLLGLMTGLHNHINVHDFGLDNITDADGLAVGTPSGFVGRTLQHLISGVYTVKDAELYKLLRLTADIENIFLEPSALAGMPGAIRFLNSEEGQNYLEKQGLTLSLSNATHIVWATGGSMVPDDVMKVYYEKGS